MTQTYSIPNAEGEYTPEEAQAFQDALDTAPNLAGHKTHGPRALKFTQNILSEWAEKMAELHDRWRVTSYMLQGNTLSSGPEDVHIPEMYKALETLVSRAEEMVMEHEPYFRSIPTQAKWKELARTKEAYIDWLLRQARFSDTIQQACCDAFICQAAAWYGWWDTQVKKRLVKEEVQSFDEDGHVQRKIKTSLRDQIVYNGVRWTLVDPLDFVIDTKASNPQNATYVGHRIWVTIDEVRRLGKMFGWANLGDELKNVAGSSTDSRTMGMKWPFDPTARGQTEDKDSKRADGRPERIELLFLFSKYDAYDNGEFEDYQFVVSGGKVVHECKRNQHDNDLRPYATGRVAKNGHAFYGIGVLDNAIRLNQHLDRFCQIVLRGAEVTAMPFVFADEDSNMPDSLYKVRPMQVFKGAGDVRFTNVPDGFIRSAMTVIAFLKTEIEETTGAFRIQQGQDDTGGTATEATLSLREGNRRIRGGIRGITSGIEQVLEITDKLAQQHSNADVEFPVLGKRALDLKRDHITINPADLLAEVKYELVGLHSLRTYGMRSVGYQQWKTAFGPEIVANPQAVDQVFMLHDSAAEMIDPETADRLVKVPTPVEQLRSQIEENEGLLTGTDIEVDDSDPHQKHIDDLRDLYESCKRGEHPYDVCDAVLQHWGQHTYKLRQQQSQQQAMASRQQQKQAMLPAEVGGTPGETGRAPMAGGMSDALASLPGQTPGETPGPPVPGKAQRGGRAGRSMFQLQNTESSNGEAY